jgi:uncharacterized protein YaeQ
LIEVLRIAPKFLDAMEKLVDRNMSFDLTRNEGMLYVTVGESTMETTLEWVSLAKA